jgi:integrase
MDKTELLSKYESNLSGSKNKNHYLSYAGDFLDYANSLDKETVNNYMKKLKRQGMSPGTINFAFRVIRRLFAVNGLEWPFRRGEAPPIGQRDEVKPALAPEIIKMMIAAAKNGKLDNDESCFLALSTIYGLRRVEMCDLRNGDIDFKQNHVFVTTVKMGRQRYHLIPVEIEPYLANHDFDKHYTDTAMSQMFWRIINKSGLETFKSEKLGWHSIRRALITLLHQAGLDPFTVHQFMRWKGAEREMAMDTRYHATHFIGLEGTKVVALEAQSDKEVFKKHPLLKLWR